MSWQPASMEPFPPPHLVPVGMPAGIPVATIGGYVEERCTVAVSDLRTLLDWRRTQPRDILELIPPPPPPPPPCLYEDLLLNWTSPIVPYVRVDATSVGDTYDQSRVTPIKRRQAPRQPCGRLESTVTTGMTSSCEKRSRMSPPAAMSATPGGMPTSTALPLLSPPEASTAPGAPAAPCLPAASSTWTVVTSTSTSTGSASQPSASTTSAFNPSTTTGSVSELSTSTVSSSKPSTSTVSSSKPSTSTVSSSKPSTSTVSSSKPSTSTVSSSKPSTSTISSSKPSTFAVRSVVTVPSSATSTSTSKPLTSTISSSKPSSHAVRSVVTVPSAATSTSSAPKAVAFAADPSTPRQTATKQATPASRRRISRARRRANAFRGILESIASPTVVSASAVASNSAMASSSTAINKSVQNLNNDNNNNKNTKDKNSKAKNKKRRAEDSAEDLHVETENRKRARVSVIDVPLDEAVRMLLRSGASLVYRTSRRKGNTLLSPDAWTLDDEMPTDAVPGTLSYVPLETDAVERCDLARAFQETSRNKGFVVKRVSRVENADLLAEFRRKVKEMERLHGDVAVLRLYHGTKREKIHEICAQNLDVTLAGSESNHTWWGHGVNFTPISYYSSHYSDLGSHRSVLVCDVLIGRVCSKQHIYDAPEIKGRPGMKYDANMKLRPGPQVLCKFAPGEFYPAYVLDYDAPAAGHRNKESERYGLQQPHWQWWSKHDLGDVETVEWDSRAGTGYASGYMFGEYSPWTGSGGTFSDDILEAGFGNCLVALREFAKDYAEKGAGSYSNCRWNW